MAVYSFTKEVNVPRLQSEIQESQITIALESISALGNDLDITFKTALSQTEEAELTALVSAHVATPMTPPPDQVEVLNQPPVLNETGVLATSPKYAPDGWVQKLYEIEFKTSEKNSIHERDYLNQDIGWAELRFYNAAGEDITESSQAVLDSDCVRTDLSWMPDQDYMIKGGLIAQIETPVENVYVWAQGAVLDDQYGGPQVTFADGGINMCYVGPRDRVGLNGVSGTMMYYTHPMLGPGAGTNKLRFVVRHPAGLKHRLQAMFEIFMES